VVAVQKVFNTTEVLTRRKLYGIYYHSITSHAPFTSCLISLSSVDTEEEEREFSTINAISKTTSNDHPEQIIPNCIVHAQAERNFKGAQSRYFELFWPHTKLPLNGRKPENYRLIRRRNTKEIMIKHKETRMAKDGED